ncbi:MAG: Crp/Fnr family transcriptional regulator [Vicinamibacterales bacterium]
MKTNAGGVANDVDGDNGALTKNSYLRATELFCDLTQEQLDRFHDSIHMRTCKAGHVFYRPGETGEVMFIMKRGSAQLYRMAPDGRKFVFAHIPPYSVFGEMAWIGQGMYECFAEACEDSLICTLSRVDVTRLILEHPQFAVRLLEIVGRRMVQAERQLENLAFRGLIPRLAEFLCREARDGVVSGFTHQEIGERLGVYRETVTYALNELKSAGIISIARRQIQVLDDGRLVRASRSG